MEVDRKRKEYFGSFLGLTGDWEPSPRSYKSAALPTELRQPDPKLQQRGEILLNLSCDPREGR